jgi:hypothetical protein
MELVQILVASHIACMFAGAVAWHFLGRRRRRVAQLERMLNWRAQ